MGQANLESRQWTGAFLLKYKNGKPRRIGRLVLCPFAGLQDEGTFGRPKSCYDKSRFCTVDVQFMLSVDTSMLYR
jgi:hypothetical protein